MDVTEFILSKYNVNFDENSDMPITIANVGRDNLSEWLHELNFKLAVEVGVAAGEYSEILCKANPQMNLKGVDPFKQYDGYNDYNDNSGTINELFEEAKKRLAAYPNFEFIEELSGDALKQFDDNSLDFVYIDANHQEPYVTEDISEWYKKVKPGGIIAGHDYTRASNTVGETTYFYNVKGAVKNFTATNSIRPWFVLGSFNPARGEIRDSVRSWMWVKA